MTEKGAGAPGPTADDPQRDPSGAPTDAAHAAIGDGTLQGSAPAGVAPDELHKIASSRPTDDGGTG